MRRTLNLLRLPQTRLRLPLTRRFATNKDDAAMAARHLSPGVSRMHDITLRKGSGSYVETVDGERLLDFTCGIAVTNLGHCHPHVVQAVQRQAGELHHAQVHA